jgi:hypothetical protein
MPVPLRCVPPLPKYVDAGDQELAPALLASMRTVTLKLATPEPTRQRVFTPGAVLGPPLPRMLAPVSACVVASCTSVPEPLKVRVTRVSTFPKPEIAVVPWYRIWFAAGLDWKSQSSLPLGSLAAVSIWSPNGTVMLRLTPMYRLLIAEAGPLQT